MVPLSSPHLEENCFWTEPLWFLAFEAEDSPSACCPSLLTGDKRDSLATPPSSRTALGRGYHSPQVQCHACPGLAQPGTLTYNWEPGSRGRHRGCSARRSGFPYEAPICSSRGEEGARVVALYSSGPGFRHTQRAWVGGVEAREVPASLAMGYRPGWGPAPALTSARRRRPAAGSTPPRPWCSPAGCWPEARRWRRDLMGKADSRLLGGEGHGQPAGTPSQSLGGAWTERPMPTRSSQMWSAQAGCRQHGYQHFLACALLHT